MKQKDGIRKITISAMLIALGIVLERVLMVPIGSLNRIAFGSSAVILSSFIVGPLFGAAVGAVVDIFGFVINNPTPLSYTPYVTLGFIALGVLPWVLNRAMRYIRRFPYYFYLSFIVLAVISGYGLWFIYSRDSYMFNLGNNNFFEVDLTTIFARVILPLLGILIFFGFVVYVQLVSKKFPRKFLNNLSTKDVVFIVLIVEVLITIFWGVQWRVWFAGIPPFVLYFNQIIFFVIGFPIKSTVVLLGLRAQQTYQQAGVI